MKSLKEMWKDYWLPTPVNVRQWADALLITFSTVGITLSNPIHTKICFAIGVILKLLSNRLKDEKPSIPPINSDIPNKLQD